jgi:hypothetical protein
MGRNKKRDYQYLIRHFTAKKLKERWAFLVNTATFLIKDRQVEEYVLVNKKLIDEIVLDYFADIKRLKDFHGIKKADLSKIAAYTTYWVLKRRPLHIKESVSEEIYTKNPFLIHMNEWFASYLLKSIVFDMGNRFINEEDLGKWNNFDNLLTYFLTYRVVTHQALELAVVAMTIIPPYELLAEGGD